MITSKPTKTFIERAVAGEFEDISEALDDAIDEWHEGISQCELHEYLGMTWDQYGRWLSNAKALPGIIAEHATRSHE